MSSPAVATGRPPDSNRNRRPGAVPSGPSGSSTSCAAAVRASGAVRTSWRSRSGPVPPAERRAVPSNASTNAAVATHAGSGSAAAASPPPSVNSW